MGGRGGYEGSKLPVFFEDAQIPLPVEVEGISVTKFNKPGTATSVPDNTRTTIVSESYIAGTFENLVILSVSGSITAKYYLQLDTGSGFTDIDVRRTSPDRNLQFDFTGAPYSLSSGDAVRVQVEHFNTGILEDFEATIYGYD